MLCKDPIIESLVNIIIKAYLDIKILKISVIYAIIDNYLRYNFSYYMQTITILSNVK